MRLRNDFTLDVPIEQAWPVLLDISRVASCLPGARIEEGEGGVYRGTMKIKLGPVTTTYQGTAQLADVDEDGHTASIAVQAQEQHGQGMAAAVITNRLVPEDGRTRVIAETDLNVSGRQAQFGRGIMQDVAGTLLGQFASRLEAELASGGAGSGMERLRGPDAAPPAPEPSADAALDVGGALASGAVRRYAEMAVVTTGLVALAVALRWRRRGLSIDVRYRR